MVYQTRDENDDKQVRTRSIIMDFISDQL